MWFHEYGDQGEKALPVMHGMICDRQKFREIFMLLEQDYRVIYAKKSHAILKGYIKGFFIGEALALVVCALAGLAVQYVF